MLEESVGEGKRGCHVKLSPNDGYRALFDMAAPRQWLHPRYLHKYIHAQSFNTKLTCHHGTLGV